MPDHLPRERVVIPAPCSCPAFFSNRLSKLGAPQTLNRQRDRYVREGVTTLADQV